MLPEAFDRAGLGDERAEQAFQLQLSLIIDGLAVLLRADLDAASGVSTTA